MHKVFILFLMLISAASARAEMPICEEFLGGFQQEMAQLERLLGRIQWASVNDRGFALSDCELFESSSSNASNQLIYLKALDATICDIGSDYLSKSEEKLARMNEETAPLCESIRN